MDIDKVQRFPITFVIKSSKTSDIILADIRTQAIAKYKIESVVDSYMNAIEDVINIKDIIEAFNTVVKSGQLQMVMQEVIIQSKVEFNYNSSEQN